ncbi:DUF2029 domain-containing protein [Alicyclobacillus fastidiosus]|uniref:DUF2029 domain-containing protein n=1 Tax=Alicyclobacillus fastidiosus TaxID=392011 RepID=A0ABY6ZCP9_9BACL|nr:glycosyltransferase family 87 protein [Alicyclobacillus fastidiosus]WAH39890.1 DUF2029 domain-containing protein [Alicyclobacillus fastidiosus]
MLKFAKTVRGLGDFQMFWTGARALDLGLDPYKPESWQIVFPSGSNGLEYFSPIFLAELQSPLGLLGIHSAKLIWNFASLLIILFVLGLLLKMSKVKQRFGYLAIAFAVLTFNPIIFMFGNGQTDALVLLGIVLSMYLLESGRSFLAGLSLCIGGVNPHLIVGVAVYYVLRSVMKRDFQLFLGMLSGGAFLFAVSIPYLSYLVEWVRTVLPHAQREAFGLPNEITFTHIVWSFVKGPAVSALTALWEVINLVMAFLFWRRSHFANTLKDVATAILLTLSTATYSFNQDYVILLAFIPYILVTLSKGKVENGKTLLPLLIVIGLLFSPLTGDMIPLSKLGYEIVFPPLVLIGAIIGNQTFHTFRIQSRRLYITSACAVWLASLLVCELSLYLGNALVQEILLILVVFVALMSLRSKEV